MHFKGLDSFINEPKKPVLKVKAPKKEIETTLDLDFFEGSFVDFIKCAEEIAPLNEWKIKEICHYSESNIGYNTYSHSEYCLQRTVIKDNPNYESQLLLFEEACNKYNMDLKVYEEELKKYNEKIEAIKTIINSR